MASFYFCSVKSFTCGVFDTLLGGQSIFRRMGVLGQDRLA